LISVAAYARVASIVSNLAAVGGIIGCGAFLLILSLVGLIGTRKHHQVLLFFVSFSFFFNHYLFDKVNLKPNFLNFSFVSNLFLSSQYMIILFILFIVQFSIAFACLSVSEHQKFEIATKGWSNANNQTKLEAQLFFNCCGFHQKTTPIECLKVCNNFACQ